METLKLLGKCQIKDIICQLGSFRHTNSTTFSVVLGFRMKILLEKIPKRLKLLFFMKNTIILSTVV